MTIPSIPKKKFKTKLEPYMIPIIDRLVRQGLPFANVAGGIGVSPKMLTKWRNEGLDENCTDELLQELGATIEAARSSVAGEGVEIMKVHAMSDWRAAEALLKAQDPDTWNPVKKVEAKVEANVSHGPVDLSDLSSEELNVMREVNRKLEAKRLGK